MMRFGRLATESTERIELAAKTKRAANQRPTGHNRKPTKTDLRLSIILRTAVIGITVVLHTFSASAQSAEDVKGPTPLVAIQN